MVFQSRHLVFQNQLIKELQKSLKIYHSVTKDFQKRKGKCYCINLCSREITEAAANEENKLQNSSFNIPDFAKKAANFIKEIDFESLEKGITEGQFSSPEEFESTTKMLFGMVIKRYQSEPNIQNFLTNMMNKCLGIKTEVPSNGAESTEQPSNSQQTAPKPVAKPSATAVQPAPATTVTDASKDVRSGVPQLTKEEKRELGDKIRSLPQKYMRGIIQIVKKENQLNGSTLEFNINKMSASVNRELMAYAEACLLKESNSVKQANPQNPASGEYRGNAS